MDPRDLVGYPCASSGRIPHIPALQAIVHYMLYLQSLGESWETEVLPVAFLSCCASFKLSTSVH